MLSALCDGSGYGQRACFACHTELGHVVHVVGADHIAHVHLLARGIDNNGSRGSFEWGEAADSLAVCACEETIAAGN